MSLHLTDRSSSDLALPCLAFSYRLCALQIRTMLWKWFIRVMFWILCNQEGTWESEFWVQTQSGNFCCSSSNPYFKGKTYFLAVLELSSWSQYMYHHNYVRPQTWCHTEMKLAARIRSSVLVGLHFITMEVGFTDEIEVCIGLAWWEHSRKPLHRKLKSMINWLQEKWETWNKHGVSCKWLLPVGNVGSKKNEIFGKGWKKECYEWAK